MDCHIRYRSRGASLILCSRAYLRKCSFDVDISLGWKCFLYSNPRVSKFQYRANISLFYLFIYLFFVRREKNILFMNQELLTIFKIFKECTIIIKSKTSEHLKGINSMLLLAEGQWLKGLSSKSRDADSIILPGLP